MLKYLYILFFVTLLKPDSFAGSGTDACMDQVKTIYKNTMNWADMNSVSGKIYYVDYSVKVTARDSVKRADAQTNIRLWLSGKKMQVLSKEMEVYQDGKDVITVIPGRKKIMRSDFVKNVSYNKTFPVLHDSLFTLSKVKSCTTTSLYGASEVVEVELSERAKTKYKIQYLLFYISADKQQFKKVVIGYADNNSGKRNGTESPIARIEYTFNQTVFDYKGSGLFQNNAENLFVDRKGQLNKQYAAYQLIDNRAAVKSKK